MMVAEQLPTDSLIPRRKLHRCTVSGCGKAFTRVSHLQRHALNHTEVKRHCDRCNAVFKRLDLLERHQERHSRTDALAGGSGLGTLRARRKIIPGANLCNKSLQTGTGKESRTTQRTPRGGDGEPIDSTGKDVNANSTHQQHPGVQTPPDPAAAISPINPPDLGDWYYDTSFDSSHFDLIGPSFSQRYTLAEVHWDNMNYISPNNVAVQSSLSPNDMNWPILQSPAAVTATEGHEEQRVSNLQRSMHVTSILNSPKLSHPRLGGAPLRQDFECFLYGGIESSQDQVPGEPALLPPFTDDKIELSLSKREEVLNLLFEIQSVYENRSLVDEINTALSLEAMQEYLSLFVQHFNVSYPLIHIPTLEVAKTESILLLSMINLGASYKTKDSHRMSVSLYDAIVPYILSGLTTIPVPSLSTLQAFLILECYGMYRAGPYQREMAMLIHTLLFNTIRRLSRYHVRGGIMLPTHLKHPRNWEEFAYAEQYKRLILFVFMWDTQNVSCYSFMPSMSTHTIQVPHPCIEEVWTARCPSAWQRTMDTHDDPPDFGDTMKWLVEDSEKLHSIPLDNLRLTLLLHGLMSMCNDMVHFDNRSIYLGDLEEQEASWRPWRKRMTSALGSWKIKYDAQAMATMQSMPDEYVNSVHQKQSIALLTLYHTAHIVINSDIRHLLGAAGAKSVFGHAVTRDDHQESYRWVKMWVKSQPVVVQHATWHAAQIFRDSTLYLKNWDAHGVFHYPWCLVIGTLTCWAFHHFGRSEGRSPPPPPPPPLCTHERGLAMPQETSRALMNQLISSMAFASPRELQRTQGKYCTHGLVVEVARYLKGVRWTAAFEAMKLLEELSVGDTLQ